MSGCIIFKGQRFSAYLGCVCCALLMMLTAGCGDEGSHHNPGDNITAADQSGTGAAVFSVQWHPASHSPALADVLTSQLAGEDCSSVGVETITIEVYDESSNSRIAIGGPWDCEDHEGVIERIPAGQNITFALWGWGDADQTNLIYHGKTTGITITAGVTEDVGTIDAYEIVPTDLTANAISNSQIDLLWAVPPEDIMGAIAGYRIYRDGEAVGTSASTTYSDTGLNSSAQYCYTVTANDAYGNESEPSDQACATTSENQAPSVNITEPADDTDVNQGVSIRFSGTAEDQEEGTLTGDALVWTSNIDDQIGTGNTFTTATLSAGVHTITLTATDQEGAYASASITLTVNDTEAPTVPGGLTGSPQGGSSIDLSWNASTDNVGVTGYRIYRDGEAVGTSATTNYSDTGLNPAIEYCYTVTAYDAADNASGPSARVCVTTIDTIAPSVPTGLTGIPSGGDSIGLSWNASSDNVGVTGYRIYRDGVDVGTSATTTYSDTGLNPATQYCYTVTAYDAMGNESGQSAQVCVTTEDTIAPSVPGNLTASAVSSSQIDLSWSTSTDNVGVAGYRIYRDGEDVGTSATTTYSDTGLNSETEYCYTVTAYDEADNESGQSNQACATTNENQAPSVNITAPANNTEVNQGDSVTFSGTGEDPEDGTLTGDALVWTSNIDGQIGTGTTFSTATLSAGVHTITLRATDQEGASASTSINLTVNDTEAPTVPGGLTGSPQGSDRINLSWNASNDNVGVTGYRIYRDGEPVGTSEATTYSDTGLNSTTEYCYTVTAYDAAGNESGPSARVCVTTEDNIAPSVPTGLTGLPRGGSRIDLSWNASSDNVGVAGYRIYRDGEPVGTSETTSYSDTGLNSATEYCYTVTAYDAAGNESGPSARVCVTTEDTIPPSVPGNLTASAVSDSQIDLSWSASTDNVGVALYRIYRDGTLIDSTSSTTYSDGDLDSGTEYCYTVTAVDGAGNESGQSNQDCDTTYQAEVNILFLNFYIDITDQNNDGYSRLAAYLRELGFNVAQANLTTITDADLSGYDIVVFGGDIQRSISTGEAGVIRSFAVNGGGLLLLGDQGLEQWSTTLFADLHRVTDPDGSGSWGIAFNADMLCDDEDYCTYCATEGDPDHGVDYPNIRPTIAHPATSGVDVFVYNWGTSLWVDPEIARTLADSSPSSWRDTNGVYRSQYDEYECTWDGEGYEPRGAYPAMAVVEPGQGRVVAIGDNGMWFNIFFSYDVVGTRALARSVFIYLSGQ